MSQDTNPQYPEAEAVSAEDIPADATVFKLVIPPGVEFEQLEIQRDKATGMVGFNMGVLLRVLTYSGIHPKDTQGMEPGQFFNMVIVAWYESHKADGGEPNAVLEDLRAEAEFERAAGQHFSHTPGHA